MTREEAIAYGNDYYRDLISACCKIDEKHKEFVKMSLKALEQEPCEDAISRADAKKYLAAPDANGDRVIYESDLDLLPPVQPKPKTGYWIPTYGNVKCSVCGSVKDSRNVGKSTHYCDFCGAKMEGEG